MEGGNSNNDNVVTLAASVESLQIVDGAACSPCSRCEATIDAECEKARADLAEAAVADARAALNAEKARADAAVAFMQAYKEKEAAAQVKRDADEASLARRKVEDIAAFGPLQKVARSRVSPLLNSVHHAEHAAKYPEIDFNFLFLTDGFNFRNTEFNAVLGLSQIKHLDRYIAIRNTNYNQFLEIIAPYSEHIAAPNHEGISAFCLPFILKTPDMKKKLQQFLREKGIESRPVIGGNLLRQPFLKDHGDYKDFKNAEFLHTNAFYIGNNQFVSHERLEKLKEYLKEFFGKEQ